MKKVLIFALCMCGFCQWQNGFASNLPDAVLSANGSEATSGYVAENPLSPEARNLAYQIELVGTYYTYGTTSSVEFWLDLVYDYNSKTQTAEGVSRKLRFVTTNGVQATFDGICNVFITNDKKGIDLVVRGTLKMTEVIPERSSNVSYADIDVHRVLPLWPLQQ